MEWVFDTFISKADLFSILSRMKWIKAEKEAEEIRDLLHKHGVEKGNVLDLMCGDGRISVFLAKCGYDVVGIDLSPSFIERAVKNARKHGVLGKTVFIIGDARYVDKFVNREFDAVIIVWQSIGYYDKETDRNLFKKLFRIVHPDGLLLIYDFMIRDKINEYLSNLPGYFLIDEFAVRAEINFDERESRLLINWFFYKMEKVRMKFLGCSKACIILYTLREIIDMLSSAGWRILEYRDPNSRRPFYIIARAEK